MNKTKFTIFLAVLLLLGGCTQKQSDTGSVEETANVTMQTEERTKEGTEMTDNEIITDGKLPEELALIPQDYFTESAHPGTLVELAYDTFESMTYEQKSKALQKRAIVYLPYGYSEDTQYNVFYLMHGGWSDETTYLGTPNQPSECSRTERERSEVFRNS